MTTHVNRIISVDQCLLVVPKPISLEQRTICVICEICGSMSFHKRGDLNSSEAPLRDTLQITLERFVDICGPSRQSGDFCRGQYAVIEINLINLTNEESVVLGGAITDSYIPFGNNIERIRI